MVLAMVLVNIKVNWGSNIFDFDSEFHSAMFTAFCCIT